MGRAYAVGLAGQARRDLADPYPGVAFSAVAHPAEGPSSSWDRDSVANVEGVGDAVGAVDEVALVADADVDYGGADSDFAVGLELDVSCTEIRTENREFSNSQTVKWCLFNATNLLSRRVIHTALSKENQYFKRYFLMCLYFVHTATIKKIKKERKGKPWKVELF